ncbi:hypothetical protein AX14_005523 [Amanita brunnescens Koide BX004]|nr:hypothetical protein AX14_005523 [Amanita brunnescens Koide BX004]
MTGTFGREVQSMRSAPLGSETRSCTALSRLIEGVQEDGSSRDDACREDDVRLAAPQAGLCALCNDLAHTVLDFAPLEGGSISGVPSVQQMTLI